MNVRLIAISRPVIEECDKPGDLIAYCARVSNPANQANKETAPRLLSYLARNAHWSPFEMGSVTMEITTTRDIARQILRHRSFAFQEFSQRYAEVQAGPVLREARMQDHSNRQNSIEVGSADLNDAWHQMQAHAAHWATDAYKWALERGIAKEVARAVLPEGLTESVLYMAGTVRSWMHYIQLRQANGTQKEHRQIALACKEILLSHIPDLEAVL